MTGWREIAPAAGGGKMSGWRVLLSQYTCHRRGPGNSGGNFRKGRIKCQECGVEICRDRFVRKIDWNFTGKFPPP